MPNLCHASCLPSCPRPAPAFSITVVCVLHHSPPHNPMAAPTLCEADRTRVQGMALPLTLKIIIRGHTEMGPGSWGCTHMTGISSGDAQGGELMKLGGMDSSSAMW